MCKQQLSGVHWFSPCLRGVISVCVCMCDCKCVSSSHVCIGIQMFRCLIWCQKGKPSFIRNMWDNVKNLVLQVENVWFVILFLYVPCLYTLYCYSSTNWTVMSPTGYPCGNVCHRLPFTCVAESYSDINAFFLKKKWDFSFFCWVCSSKAM